MHSAGRLPNFIIVGAGRSGTTSLTHYLRAHPEVFMSEQKELHFFDQHFERGVDWYRARFAEAISEAAVGEATPNYLHHPEAIRRMALVIPEARLIAVLRNPIDRAYSAYWHRRALGREPRGFEEAMEIQPGRTQAGDPGDSYLERSRYVGALRRVCEFFPMEALHVLLFEDLAERAADTYQDVCRFLGIDHQFLPESLGMPFNAFVGFRSLALRNLGKRVPGWAGRILGRLNSVRGVPYPPLDPATRARLKPLFREDNRALAEFLGRDLSVWESGVQSGWPG